MTATASATPVAFGNEPFIACWNDVLTPKWIRFRHLLSGNGKIHSDLARRWLDVRRGDRVLDVGCGFGETCLELARRVGPEGRVLGLDCTEAFLDVAERERAAAGADNVCYRLADIESCRLPEGAFDLAFSRFGVMFCSSPVRALRNAGRALAPGGRLMLIVWRTIRDNPCWRDAEAIALEHLPPPDDGAQTCGPGPFSFASEDTDRLILDAAGFGELKFNRIDVDICVGTSLAEAIEYQVQVGPAGYVIREAGERGRRALPAIREQLAAHYARFARADGSVWMPSSTWVIRATRMR